MKQIFFDDDISEKPECSVVDARSLSNWKMIDFKDGINKHLIKISSIKVIPNNKEVRERNRENKVFDGCRIVRERKIRVEPSLKRIKSK